MRTIKNVTVIGANGTMGRNIAAIFASFGNAKVHLICRTMEKSISARDNAYQSVRADSIKDRLIPGDYSSLADCIRESDLIFEACAENWEIKASVHKMIAEVLNELPDELVGTKVICSGTSGLSITALAELYSEAYRPYVIGMHFFNPPYNMTLCELIPTRYTNSDMFDSIFSYAKTTLLRTVVKVKDAPAFLGNRIGFYFINLAMQMAEKYRFSGGIDYIDAIFGSFTGRAMAPLVTANFVGLDVHKAIMDNLHLNTSDYAADAFRLPDYVEKLVSEKKLGRKSGVGLYKTLIHDSGVKIRQVFDIEHGYYREAIRYNFPFAEEMISAIKYGDYEDACNVLKENRSVEAELCTEMLLKYVLYSLFAADEVGFNVHAADDVMAAGFNWCPPLAMVEAFGGKEAFSELCRERISETESKAMDMEKLLGTIENSKYDYRAYMKAKR